MTISNPDQPASYELPILSKVTVASDAINQRNGRSLPELILARNVLWFCWCRWIVVIILLGFGIMGRFDGLIRHIGLLQPGLWPFVLSGVLILCNVVYLICARSTRASRTPNGSTANLWAQIVLDILILTAVVHFLGSIRTYIPFAYLFHIVLACVFFSRWQSLTVVLMASAMFAACVIAEYIGVLPVVHVFTNVHPTPDGAAQLTVDALSFPSAVGIWLVVWYMVSYLSKMVRTRDIKLAETNDRLMAAQKDRSRHMLTMTHQLKAPFAAIHANIQLLLQGYCGELPEEAMDVARRIAARSRRLTGEIQEMLQLANLSSNSQKLPDSVELDISEVLNWSIELIRPLAKERRVTIDVDIQPVRTKGVEDHLKMLFSNLLSNAVLYSHKGGRISIQCSCESPSQGLVSVSDEGIGIAPEKLPHIFDEHYRTREAVCHNKESSGLGLAIVKHVTELHGIRLEVQSQLGTGTTFKLWFPCVAA